MLAGTMYGAITSVQGKGHEKEASAFLVLAALQCVKDQVASKSGVDRLTEAVTCLALHASEFAQQAADVLKRYSKSKGAGVEKAAPALAEIALGVTAASAGAELGE